MFSRKIILTFIGLLSFSLVLGKVFTSSRTYGAYKPKVIGTWAEKWGKEGWESNVEYVDTLVVDLDQKGRYFMYCKNKRHFNYDRITFEGDRFNFRMENSGSEESKFYVYYRMMFGESADELVGDCVNSRQDHNYVRMSRIK